MAKKAQGLSLNTVVIAAIALLVLIIIASIFSGKLSLFSTDTRLCENKGDRAHCVDAEECPAGEAKVGDFSNTNCRKSCCLPLYDNS